MIDTKNDFSSLTGKRDDLLASAMERIYAAAQPGAVYSDPVISGAYTVILAREVAAGGGFGSGSGFGPQQKKADEKSSASPQISSGGGGIGGGGGSNGRPVAIIVIGPDGVTIKPIFDFTKIILAGIAVWSTMFVLFGKVRRGTKH